MFVFNISIVTIRIVRIDNQITKSRFIRLTMDKRGGEGSDDHHSSSKIKAGDGGQVSRFGRDQEGSLNRRVRVLLRTISRSCDLGRNSCAIYHQQRFGDRVTAPLLPPFIERKPRKEAMHWAGGGENGEARARSLIFKVWAKLLSCANLSP